jgi:hypothetical protein
MTNPCEPQYTVWDWLKGAMIFLIAIFALGAGIKSCADGNNPYLEWQKMCASQGGYEVPARDGNHLCVKNGLTISHLVY